MQTKVKRKSRLLLPAALLLAGLLLGGLWFLDRYSEQIKNRLGILDPDKTVFSVFSEEEAPAGRLSELLVSPEAFQSLMDSRRESARPLLADLRFSGGGLFRDWGSGWWYYSLKEASDEAYDPLVAYTGRQNGVQLAVLGSISPEQIRSGGHIQLLAYTGTRYSRHELVCTTLPLLSVTFTARELLETYNLDQIDYPIYLGLYDNRADADRRLSYSGGEMHIRGRTTASFPKLGYKITLLEDGAKRKENLLGLRRDDDWILYAGYNDQEKLRNVFCSELWKSSCARNNLFGVDNGMEYRYVEAFFNGRYAGLYALGYPLDAKQLDLGDSGGPEPEYIYQKKDFVLEEEADLSAAGPLPAYELKDSSGSEGDEAWAPLRAYYRALFSGDPSAIKDAVDLENAVDVFLFLTLTQNRDNAYQNQIKNLYFTAKSLSPAGYKILCTPWDMDLSWGNFYNSEKETLTDCYIFSPSFNIDWSASPVARLIGAGDGETLGLLEARYTQLRSESWSEEALMALLDRYEAEIFGSGAYERDRERWPWGEYLEDSSQGLTLFREFVRSRLIYMDSTIDQILTQ